MNRKNYIKAFSKLNPSPQVVERILQIPKTSQKEK